jgi:threonine dehydrogenase-like Zn-dependent dehydrogenase
MKAIRFKVTIPRYISGITIGKVFPRYLWSGQSCTVYEEVSTPDLPSEDWVLIRTLYGGICGSDMSAVQLRGSPYFSALISSQYTLGHENAGCIEILGSEVSGWEVGERVVVEPTLWCTPRGYEDLCRFCARGEINRCERTGNGNLAPGLSIGNCQDTSGSWSAFFLAHKSQLYHLPDQISDENSLMVEPFSTSLHAVLQNFPSDDDKVLILGAGTIGLCTLAALRALGSQAEIFVLARYPFQAEAAHKLGASKVIPAGRNDDYYEEIKNVTGASLIQPILGKRVVIGGIDLTYECVGSDNSVDDAMRLTRAGGKVVLLGMPGIVKGIDWTSIFINELDVRGTYIFNHAENYQGKIWKTFDLSIDLMARGEVDLGWLVTHRFKLEENKRAFAMLSKRGKNQVIKAVFEFKDPNNA